MWHEARRQEKLIRSQMIDSVKRNERRKQFYENVEDIPAIHAIAKEFVCSCSCKMKMLQRKDPEQFMQVHGRKCQIHMDPAVARAAEASSILRRWQGDPNVLIDRFDVRAHMDYIPETKSDDIDKRSVVDVEELQCEYERYRILVLNEFDRVSEKTFLKEIAAKEFWPDESTSTSLARAEQEKKRLLRDRKAAVAFTYGDTQTVQGKSVETDDSDEDEIVDSDEFDLKLDIDTLDAEQRRNLNKLGIRYGISSGAFSSLLKMDRREQDETHQLKEIEKAKLALAGRQAKAERAVLKKKRALIVGKGCLNEEATTTLLSFVTKSQKEHLETSVFCGYFSGDIELVMSSSSSTEEDEGKTEFITTFGGDGAEDKDEERDDDDDGGAKMHGPALPSAEFRRIFELKTRRSSSPEDFGNVSRTRVRSRSPGRKRFLRSSHERTLRSRSRERLRRSRSREWHDRSRSSSNGKKRRCSKSRDRLRSHSREDDRRSDHGRSRSRDRRREEVKMKQSRRKSSSSSGSGCSRSRGHYNRKRRTGEGSESSKKFTDKKRQKRRRYSSSSDTSRTPPPPSPQDRKGTGSVLSPSRSNGNTSPLEIRSSMSESEKERIEVENRRRRIRRTAKMHRQQYGGSHHDRSSEDEAERKAALAHKLRTQMQRVLRKTAEQLKEEERQKHEEHEKERRLREERLFEESLEIRRR
uniref:DRY_EERY domain-containing protein n=1 Tax=Elaeophora elaphi TaxID=1147741 RepID=A0A0R3RWX4_9BILA